MVVDDRRVLLLLFPQTRMVHIIDQQGNELRRWPCQQKNSRPIAAASNEGRVIIADSKSHTIVLMEENLTTIDPVSKPIMKSLIN